jgi:TDG/mug DNA glycosylase family protein
MSEVLPDVLDHGLVVVFCGTAASNVSARVGAYYANPTNAFWPTLHTIGMTPRLLNPKEFRGLLELKIGLTDLAKFASGTDRKLKRRDFERQRLHDRICRFQPQIVAFTSKAAWRACQGLASQENVAYGWQKDELGATRFYVLPSPSGAARGYWDLEPWTALADDYHHRMSAK